MITGFFDFLLFFIVIVVSMFLLAIILTELS